VEEEEEEEEIEENKVDEVSDDRKIEVKSEEKTTRVDESEKEKAEEEDEAPALPPATVAVIQEQSLGHIMKGSPFHEQEHSVQISVLASAAQVMTLGHIMKGSPFEEHPSTPITIDEVTTEVHGLIRRLPSAEVEIPSWPAAA
jgi:hypothetical protein